MLPLARFADRIVATFDLPPRPARHAPLPDDLHPALRAALADRGIAELFSHQAEMYAAARRGEHVVITTGTASGKSLAFLLPVLQGILEDPAARAFLLYPTKALGHDQLRAILKVCEALSDGAGRRIEAGVYDGDTPPAERRRIRERCNLVLTNPDMLHTGMLPAHARPGFSHLFRNVRFVVLDELHTYRGAFGSHIANLMRRFSRIAHHCGSTPQFLCSSATIANPTELASRLCHAPFTLIDRDGSPAGAKRIHFWLPPTIDGVLRRGVASEMAALLPYLIEKRIRTIGFARSRKETEIIVKEARDRLARTHGGHDESRMLGAYRAGFTPAERRRVERDLIEGRLVGVVSTNALELGIDIGSLEVVVQGGFPGTRASFWQQVGRAGRRGGMAHAIVILAMSPVDQYLARHPEWLMDQPSEHAAVDPDNLGVVLAHVRAAAAELPLTMDDAAIWPDLGEAIPVLVERSELRELSGAWHWQGGPFPAGDFSLRNHDGSRWKIVDIDRGTTLTEMTRPQVYREAHPRAVYLHDGEQYSVEELDLVQHRALVRLVEQNFYTQPDVRTQIEVMNTQESRAIWAAVGANPEVESLAFDAPAAAPWLPGAPCFGDVRVFESVVGFKMLQFHNHQNLGYEVVQEPLTLQLETEALWLPMPEPVLAALGGESTDLLVGVVHALRAVARMATMAEASDLAGSSFSYVDDVSGRRHTAIVLYDLHPGGIGFAQKAFELVDTLADRALSLVRDCRCADGCPACVGDFTLDRHVVAWAIGSLRQVLAPPAGLRLPAGGGVENAIAGGTTAHAPLSIALAELPARWAEACAHLHASQAPGAELLASVPEVRVRGSKLLLRLVSPGLQAWLEQDHNRNQLRRTLLTHLTLPESLQLAFEVEQSDAQQASRRRDKLRRRLEDLREGESSDERSANRKLASGYLPHGDRGGEV